MLTRIGSVISDTNTSHSSTARTRQNARAVFKVALLTASLGCTRRTADQIGLSMRTWTDLPDAVGNGPCWEQVERDQEVKNHGERGGE